MMNWNNCFSNLRLGTTASHDKPRTEYQRDYDRLIFASAFRRLQNKTQVFPLPGSTFVHNRLTHSLEVASVGRSLGQIIGEYIAQHDIPQHDTESQHFYTQDLSSVIAAACLAHDIGNPAFGHSGEKAISDYFLKNADVIIEDGMTLRGYFTESEWRDLTQFEGNANALRILTHHYRNRPEGGMRLTVTTLAAIIKYPCDSSSIDRDYAHRKKYGYLLSERQTFLRIAEELHMIPQDWDKNVFKRHPFVYLVEAADDICYRIIDLEDAHRLGIVSKADAFAALHTIIDQLSERHESQRVSDTFDKIDDDNDAIAYLRAKAINALTLTCADIFIHERQAILQGQFNSTLLDQVAIQCPALNDLMQLSIDKIYNHPSVLEIEITGFHVMSHLLELFVPAVLRNDKQGTDQIALRLIPKQFTEYEICDSPYHKVLSIVDFISGMTDAYATEFYRKTSGIDISKHR